MSEINWICQGCGKAFIDSAFSYELKVPDMESCNRCGWKRKPKSAEVIQREKDMEDRMVSGTWRIKGHVIDAPAMRSGEHNNCCPRIC